MGHSLSPLAFKVWRRNSSLNLAAAAAKNNSSESGVYLLAISGGKDSLALLRVFAEFEEKKNIRWEMAHVDHGPSEDPEIVKYRKVTCQRVALWAKKLGKNLYTQDSVKIKAPLLRSEAEMREYRYKVLRQIQIQVGAIRIVTAHHAEDLLETRMMNLIRGTGAHGLNSLPVDDGQLFRPLLEVWPAELQTLANLKTFKVIEDPSNKDRRYRRNWMRTWLSEMADHIPGSKMALARSLETIANILHENESAELWPLPCKRWQQLSLVQRRCVLAKALRERNIKNYTLRHIDEIIKRLDTPRKSLKFSVLGSQWQVVDGMISFCPSSR